MHDFLRCDGLALAPKTHSQPTGPNQPHQPNRRTQLEPFSRNVAAQPNKRRDNGLRTLVDDSWRCISIFPTSKSYADLTNIEPKPATLGRVIPKEHFYFLTELIENFCIDPEKMSSLIMPPNATTVGEPPLITR
jgi:hypothetical protein